MRQKIIYALRNGRNGMESAQSTPAPARCLGANGWNYDPVSSSPQTSPWYLTQYPTSRCFTTASGWAHCQKTEKLSKKRTVERYLLSMVQIFAIVGANEPRLYNLVKIYLRLSRQLCAYARTDPPTGPRTPCPHRTHPQMLASPKKRRQTPERCRQISLHGFLLSLPTRGILQRRH